VNAQEPLQREEIIGEGKRMPKELQLKKSDAIDPRRRALTPEERSVTEEPHNRATSLRAAAVTALPCATRRATPPCRRATSRRSARPNSAIAIE